ncbi:extracellular calcium-sensing receptor-like [Mixophyes fleayi]|uniref:extracellular calcium-sensing receptor-like n=1 Tax=Mixophyes fleayi TaxID=3061075 RepID=UPI003F4DF715
MTILILLQLNYSVDQRCKLDVPALEGLTQPGDIMIGFLTPIFMDKVYQNIFFTERPPRTKCALFKLDDYQQVLALMFAVKEINMNPNVLGNITLGSQVYKTCNVPHYEVQGAFHLLTESSTAIPNYRCRGQPTFSAVIGSTISTNSIILANILGVFRYPQISASSSISLLSNRIMFPSFVRTVPSDKEQSIGLAKLILHFGWTWIGLLAAENDYGLQGIQPIRQEIIKAGACVAFTEYIRLTKPDRNAPHIVKVIKESSVKVIIIFSTDVDLVPIMSEMLKQKIKGKILVSNAGWSMSNLFSARIFSQILSGSIGLFINNRVIPGFNEYINKVQPSLEESWENLYWEKLFNCKFLYQKNITSSLEPTVKECTGAESIDSMKNSFIYTNSLKFTHGYYAAVHVVAKALEDLKNCKSREGKFSYMSCKDILHFKPWQFLLCLTWLSLAPPFQQFNIQTKPGIIIVECNEGSSIAFWTMLGYLFLLATISFIVAFLARRLPDSFNEAQFITFSMLAFLSVWVSFIPASLSAQGKYTVAMEIFAILASSWALVICMFLPKCFIIVLRPDMNSREYLMRKKRDQSKSNKI